MPKPWNLCAERRAPPTASSDSSPSGTDSPIFQLAERYLQHYLAQDLDACAELLAADGIARFHQDGAFAGQQGTMISFEIPMVVVLEIEGGRIVRHLDIVDVPRYMEQLRIQLP